MFDPNLSLFSAESVEYPETDAIYALVDGPSAGRTLRVADDGKSRLIIGHQASNENPGFPTQRSVLRSESVKTDTESGKEVKLVVQIQQSVPKGHFTVAEVNLVLKSLINFLRSPGEDPGSEAVEDLTAGLSRLYAGEP